MPDRITLSRRKGWRLPEGAVSVARPTIWGNPWKVGVNGSVLPPPHPGLPPCVYPIPMLDAETAISWYRAWLDGYAITGESSPWRATLNRAGCRLVWDAFAARRALILRRLPELRGRDLACWCKPGCLCHGDILLELANA